MNKKGILAVLILLTVLLMTACTDTAGTQPELTESSSCCQEESSSNDCCQQKDSSDHATSAIAIVPDCCGG